MKILSSLSIAALLTATGIFAATSTSLAQTPSQTQAAPASTGKSGAFNFRHAGRGPGSGGGYFWFGRSAEAMERTFSYLGARLDLSTEQQELFDSFKAATQAAAATFRTTTESLLPQPATPDAVTAPRDFSQRLNDRIAFDTARLDALKAVQPAMIAFFDSLSAEQKAQLPSRRPNRTNGWDHNTRWRHGDRFTR